MFVTTAIFQSGLLCMLPLNLPDGIETPVSIFLNRFLNYYETDLCSRLTILVIFLESANGPFRNLVVLA